MYGRRRLCGAEQPELQPPPVRRTRRDSTPVQGAAADIIKIAMNAVPTAESLGLTAKLILQVHDELIVEAPEEEREPVETLLRRCMENAASLRVPLIADVHSGRSWYDTK
ncbi:MAG: DNA polymerase [Christensenellales bacterium]